MTFNLKQTMLPDVINIPQGVLGQTVIPAPGQTIPPTLFTPPQEVADQTYGKKNDSLDASLALRNLPSSLYCYSTLAGAQVIPNLNGTTVLVDTFETNFPLMAAVNGRITAYAPGQYLLSATVQWNSNSAGTREAFIRKNGTTIIADNIMQPPATDLCSIVISTLVTLLAGDYLELRVFQNTGSNLSVRSAYENTHFSIQQL